VIPKALLDPASQASSASFLVAFRVVDEEMPAVVQVQVQSFLQELIDTTKARAAKNIIPFFMLCFVKIFIF
jgi:hypothetical protein